MRTRSVLSVAILFIFAGTPANADSLFNSDPQFSVTDLGTSYSTQFGPDGKSIQSVTNAAGNETYAYDKSPVQFSSEYSNVSGSEVNVSSLKVGSYQVANYMFFSNRIVNSSVGWTNLYGESPISDINASGQVVGQIGESARFTLPNLQHHVIPSLSDGSGMAFSDMLDIYIPPVSGLSWLTSAFGIDDDGRILARGNNSHIYLLTPTAVPEPTPLMMFGSLVVGYGVLSVRRSFHRPT